MLPNNTTKTEVSRLLNIPVKHLQEKQGTMKGFSFSIQFLSILKNNPLANKKFPNLANSMTYDYECHFNVANYSAEELQQTVKENIETIRQSLNETFKDTCFPFTPYVGQEEYKF